MREPVLVAGAGPVGLTMAMALRRLGVDVRIVDTAAARTDKSKALVVWSRTLELLDIQGCVQGFLDAGQRGTGARMFANGHELVHLTLDAVRSVYNFALLLPQSETERVLEQELARLGTTVERRVTLHAFTDDGDGVTATLLHTDGAEEVGRFHSLVGCDGAHSTVRHGLGIAFEGRTEPSDWLLADLTIDGDLSRHELAICWQPDGVLALFPIVGGRFRVIADVGLAPTEAEPPPTLADIQALLDSRGPTNLAARDPVWLSRFRINERKVKEYRKGRVFLAGDAAHIHSPAGGQGMNTGMQDAFNLAWKLAMVRDGRAGEGLLDSYSRERSAIGDQVLRNASQMTRAAILRNPILQEIRNLAVGMLGHIQLLRQRMVDQLCEVDLHYADGPLTGHGPGAARHPANGHRAPDVSLDPPGAMRLHELLRSGRFAVLSVGVPPMDLPSDLGPIAMAARAASDADYETGHHFLIRPDAYVAFSTRGDAQEPLIGFLHGLLAL